MQDLGLDKSGELNARCHFPWLLSNVIHLNGKRIVCTHEYHIVRRKGWRIGVIGLAEYGWLASLNAIDIEQVIYDDFVTSADRLSEMLSKLTTPNSPRGGLQVQPNHRSDAYEGA